MTDWNAGGNNDAWGGDAGAGDNWGGGGDTGAVDSWGAGGDAGGANGAGGDAGGDSACRFCHKEGHFARECPDKPEGGGLTGECFNCGEVGHNKADCTNPKVDRPFTGTCNGCGEEGHSVRDCPKAVCKLCDQPGHKALECKNRRKPDWTGVPELTDESAWELVIAAAQSNDLDRFRAALKAYARALDENFKLPEIENVLRDHDTKIFLIAKKVDDIPVNMTIVDMIGNPAREYILTFQHTAKPRRKNMEKGWPTSPEENMLRLSSCGFLEDIGVPLCSNCGELGHIKKHCKDEVPEVESHKPKVTCIICTQEGHRARDCTEPRVNPFACKNCGQEGHISKECPEPRSAATVECRKCNEMGHFSKDCPNVAARTCRNCGSADHIAKECDQPRNPDTITCRNCEKTGHFSKDCTEPKDWSKVQCSNCKEMGHTIRRCKQPVVEEAADGGWGDAGGAAVVDTAAAGGWNTGADAVADTGASNDWNTGADAGGAW